MNILYLTDPHPDYLADQIYTGLCRILGWESVVDYPFKEIYHQEGKKIWYLPQVPGKIYSEADVVDLLQSGHFGFVCLSSPRKGSLEALKALHDRTRLPPVVIIDGEDDARIRYEVAETYGVRLYFKREYIWVNGKRVRRIRDFYNYMRSFRYDKELFQITYPLPLSVILESIPKAEAVTKDIDVSFRGFMWSKESRKRLMALRILKEMESIQFSGGIYTPRDSAGRVSPDEYFREIFRSKIVISIRGGGFDTLRFWEIPACRTLLLSEEPDIVIPDTFEHKKHAVFCRSDLSDLGGLVRHYLENDLERETIAKEGYQHLLKYHTCEKRANYFLDVCFKEL